MAALKEEFRKRGFADVTVSGQHTNLEAGAGAGDFEASGLEGLNEGFRRLTRPYGAVGVQTVASPLEYLAAAGPSVLKFGLRGIAAGLAEAAAEAVSDATGAPVVAPKVLLSKAERLAEFNKRLHGLPNAKSADEALAQIGKTLDDVEDTFSGVAKSKNPGLDYDGRMYPPQADNIQRLPDGSIKVRTKGNRIDIAANGSITITDLSGNPILTKPGGSQ